MSEWNDDYVDLCVLLLEQRAEFLGRAELQANKRAAGRPKDLLDLELLRG